MSDLQFIQQFDETIPERRRRFQGAYFTPPHIVQMMHERADSTYPGWRETDLVWDCCSGTANLTGGYEFTDLIITTLESEELELTADLNVGATKAVYDFLQNTPVPHAVEARLLAAKETGKTLHFFINPPYATGGNKNNLVNKERAAALGKITGNHAGLVTNHPIKEIAAKEVGGAMIELTTLFWYRAIKIAEEYGLPLRITTLSKVTPFSGVKQHKFRKWFYNKLQFKSGILFNAQHFQGVKSPWAVALTLWTNGKQATDSLNFDLYGTEGEVPPAPSTAIPEGESFDKWVADCYHYFIFGSKNNCASLRNVPYKDSLLRFQNHTFWLTRADFASILIEQDKQGVNVDELMNDIDSDTHEPALALKLKELTPSPKAAKMLNLANQLLIRTLHARKAWNDMHPEHHVLTWDAGLYQLRAMFEKVEPDLFKEFSKARRELMHALRYGVYAYGFLPVWTTDNNAPPTTESDSDYSEESEQDDPLDYCPDDNLDELED